MDTIDFGPATSTLRKLVASVADEEAASLGMEDVLRHVRPDAAIVTEPTELALCLAHKGFAWIDVTVHGRAAHGSRFDPYGKVLNGPANSDLAAAEPAPASKR